MLNLVFLLRTQTRPLPVLQITSSPQLHGDSESEASFSPLAAYGAIPGPPGQKGEVGIPGPKGK